MSRPALSLAVVGADHPNGRGPTRRFEIAMCKPGEPIELRPEPKNPADSRAIAVYSARDVKLGYVTAERCAWIGAMIRNGREMRVIFQAATKTGAVVRVGFDGEEPTLPPAPPPAKEREDQDFWPDEEWPD